MLLDCLESVMTFNRLLWCLVVIWDSRVVTMVKCFIGKFSVSFRIESGFLWT